MIRKIYCPVSGFLLLFLIFGFYFNQVKAQVEIPDSIVTERLLFLKNTLNQDRTSTKRWWVGWLAGYSAATIGQGAVYFGSSDKSTRQDMALGAATTFLGSAGQLISPFIPNHEIERLNLLPENSPSERLKKLANAERLFGESAKREKEAMNWKNHALTGTVNLGSGLITWLGFKRSVWAGVGNFALNTVITEAQIWTQPILAKKAFQKYRYKYIGNDDGLTFEPESKWYIEAFPGGIVLKLVF